MSYTYKKFIEESREISIDSDNVFKICSDNLLRISYLKFSVALKNNINLEGDIVFSEVYNLPEMYFHLINDSGQYIQFNDYINDCPPYDVNMIKNAEIGQRNHPLNGIVYNYMHLCQFNIFINELKDIKNILIFWLSFALQIFNIDVISLIKHKLHN